MEKVLLDKLFDLEIKFDQAKLQMDQMKDQIVEIKNIINQSYIKSQNNINNKLNGEVSAKTNMVHSDESLLNVLLEWCKETAKDHHTIFLLDKAENNYYFITSPIQNYGPHTINKLSFENYEQFVAREEKQADVIYCDNKYKIIIQTTSGIKRGKRLEIIKSVQIMIESREFTYCEF